MPARKLGDQCLVLGAVLAALAVLASVVVLNTAAPGSRAGGTLSGAYRSSNDAAGAARFGTWRGSRETIVTDFAPSDSWAALSSPTWLADAGHRKGYHLAVAVPLLPRTGGSLQEGASGSYNRYFRTLAQLLASRGLGTSVIRLGWEMNAPWFNWSATSDPFAYVAFWRQAVDSMRAVPGTSFTFDWSPVVGEGSPGFDVASAYPGDAYVDVIGMSLYDRSWRHSSADPAGRWTEYLTEPFGLNWSASFARGYHKRSALGEWGLSQRCDGLGGGDDAYFVAKVHDWIRSHVLYYESYFDADIGSCEKHAIMTREFPRAASMYKRLWSAT